MTLEARDRIGQTLGDRFTVLGVIGEGGMGAVFDVRHEYTKQRGALKLLHQRYSAVDEVVSRFINEASAAGRIESRHIVRTFDAGRLPETNEPYIFMERLEGTSLANLLAMRGTLHFDEALELVGQVADGLAAAHQVGIVHRDIKPDNLFVVKATDAFVKILDFGISKFTSDRIATTNLTQEGATLGTPAYMPPEQIMGQRELDHRADIYSLGVVLYQCVTGSVPFDSEVYHELCQMICDGHYLSVSQLRAQAPLGFDALINQAMATDMNQRFASMAEFRAAMVRLGNARVESFAPTQPDTAAPPTFDPMATDASARVDDSEAQPAERTEDVTQPQEATLAPASSISDASSSTPSGPSKSWIALGVVASIGVAWAVIAVVGNPGGPSPSALPDAEASGEFSVETAVEPARASAGLTNPATGRDDRPTRGESAEPPAAAPLEDAGSQVTQERTSTTAPGIAARGNQPKSATKPTPQHTKAEAPTAPPTTTPRRSVQDGLSSKNPFE